MPQHGRVLWRHLGDHSICTVHWSIINVKSYVVVTVAEADVPSGPLVTMPVSRVIGAARHMVAANISPFPGGVRFGVHWAGLGPHDIGAFPHLNIWTDITVFGPKEPSVQLVVSNTTEANMAHAGPS